MRFGGVLVSGNLRSRSASTIKVDCRGKGLRVCFKHFRILNFAPDFSFAVERACIV
jgi:hypothetical protein